MATKAKYYVEDFVGGEWLRESFSERSGAFNRAVAYSQNGLSAPVRIRHKGRVIARWKDGHRVPQERGQ